MLTLSLLEVFHPAPRQCSHPRRPQGWLDFSSTSVNRDAAWLDSNHSLKWTDRRHSGERHLKTPLVQKLGGENSEWLDAKTADLGKKPLIQKHWIFYLTQSFLIFTFKIFFNVSFIGIWGGLKFINHPLTLASLSSFSLFHFQPFPLPSYLSFIFCILLCIFLFSSLLFSLSVSVL